GWSEKFPATHKSNTLQFQKLRENVMAETLTETEPIGRTWRCGHARTPENTLRMTARHEKRGYAEKCLTCYRASDARYRGTEKGRVPRPRAGRAYKARLQEFLAPSRRQCGDCGTTAGRLHLHHLIPAEKLFNLADGGNHTRSAVLAELAKCVCLC